MAAIDSLLKLIDAQKADGLVLEPGAPPALLVGEGQRRLSMPPLDAAMVGSLVEELLSEPERAALAERGEVTLEHEAAGLGTLAVRVRREEDQLSASFRLRGSEAAVASPTDPVAPRDAGSPVASPVASPGASPGALTGGSPEPSPAVPVAGGEGDPHRLEEILRQAVARQAADVFLSVGGPARWRLQGTMSVVDGTVVTEADLEALLAASLAPSHRERLAEHGSVDLALELASTDGGAPLRYRVSLFQQARGLAAALRPVARRIPTLGELSLPPALAALIDLPHGLVLMTGPTGSGKSTTLAVLLGLLHQTRTGHVVTIEDPIEYQYPPGRCLIHQRQLGTHVSSYADGLRAALRSAPDVILVGEMRDAETIAAALTAAETGHLVLSTLHCGTAAMAVDRIIDGFPEGRQAQIRLQLSDVLRTVVSQRLVEAVSPGERLPALEILHVTHAVGALIREGRSHQIATVIQTGRDRGMVSLERSLAELVRSGRVSRSVARAAANDPKELDGLL